ncbi:MAG: ATP-dependent helicase, partial [Candidatus Micrarchaeota archaeon]|nr:ATP-dependent helicase [Candidatus Micrarchaeota archaeon]
RYTSHYSDIAVFARSVKHHLGPLIERLNEEGIPHEVYALPSVLSYPEVKAVALLLYKAFGYEGREDEIVEIWRGPIFKQRKAREVDPVGLNATELSRKANISPEVARLWTTSVEEEEVLSALYTLLGRWKWKEQWLKNIGKFTQIIQAYQFIYGELTRDQYKEFLKMAYKIPESVTLREREEIKHGDGVIISTIHQAKGTEFPIVIMASMVNKRWPRKKRKLLLPPEAYLYPPYDEEKEQQNLFYVGMSRAKDMLIFTSYRSTHPGGFPTTPLRYLYPLRIKKRWRWRKVDRGKSHSFIRVNFSALSTYVDCGARFNYAYLYGLKAEEILEQKIGTLYARALASVNLALKKRERAEIDKIVEENWVEGVPPLLKPKIKKDLERYVRYAQLHFSEIVEVEKPLRISLSQGIMIEGRADLLARDKEGRLWIVDFKARKKEEIEETHVDLQLSLYKKAVKADRLGAYALYDGEMVEIEEKEMEEILKDFYQALKKRKLEPKKTKFCEKCPYRPLCFKLLP